MRYTPVMLSPGAGKVIEVRRGGIAIVGEMPLAMGQHVQLGQARGVVLELRDETVVVGLLHGSPDADHVVQAAPDPGVPVGPEWLGHVWTEATDGQHAPRPPAPSYVRANPAEAWLSTGFRALDSLAPVTDRTALLLVGQDVNNALLAMASTPREAAQILLLPCASAAELQRARRKLGPMAPHTVIVTSSPAAPQLAHLGLLDAAASLIESLRVERPVVVIAPDLHRIAIAARALDRALGRARDHVGWSLRTGQLVSSLTDRCAGVGHPVSMFATASLEEPGLDDHLVPWFDRTHHLVPATRPRMLPALDPARLSPARNFLLPRQQRIQADTLRAELVFLAQQRDLATVTRDPDLMEGQERLLRLLQGLEQPLPA